MGLVQKWNKWVDTEVSHIPPEKHKKESNASWKKYEHIVLQYYYFSLFKNHFMITILLSKQLLNYKGVYTNSERVTCYKRNWNMNNVNC